MQAAFHQTASIHLLHLHYRMLSHPHVRRCAHRCCSHPPLPAVHLPACWAKRRARREERHKPTFITLDLIAISLHLHTISHPHGPPHTFPFPFCVNWWRQAGGGRRQAAAAPPVPAPSMLLLLPHRAMLEMQVDSGGLPESLPQA